MSNTALTEGCADFLIETTWLINLSNHRHRSPIRLLKLPELRGTEVDGPPPPGLSMLQLAFGQPRIEFRGILSKTLEDQILFDQAMGLEPRMPRSTLSTRTTIPITRAELFRGISRSSAIASRIAGTRRMPIPSGSLLRA